jgi:beta-lactam-binding protein with PASTA domain
VMPSLVGLNYAVAVERAGAAGLHLILNFTAPPATGSPDTVADPSAPPVPAAAAIPSNSSIVVSQFPQPGRRVVTGDAVHVGVSQPNEATPSQ